MNKILQKIGGILLMHVYAFLIFNVNFARADSLDYGELDYEKAYTSQDNISEKNIDSLVKAMNYQSVISRVGPPVEKIEKSVKKEDIWIYNSFAAIFKKGLLADLKINPSSDLINRVMLDPSFETKKINSALVKTNNKVNPDIEGLLKDFGLVDGNGTKSE